MRCACTVLTTHTLCQMQPRCQAASLDIRLIYGRQPLVILHACFFGLQHEEPHTCPPLLYWRPLQRATSRGAASCARIRSAWSFRSSRWMAAMRRWYVVRALCTADRSSSRALMRASCSSASSSRLLLISALTRAGIAARRSVAASARPEVLANRDEKARSAVAPPPALALRAGKHVYDVCRKTVERRGVDTSEGAATISVQPSHLAKPAAGDCAAANNLAAASNPLRMRARRL